MSDKFKYYLLHKPYGYISQFTVENKGDQTLSDLMNIPVDTYPVGRLDKDSEGLLLLTNDNQFKTSILTPGKKVPKTYLVIVEGIPTAKALNALREGVTIRVNKVDYFTQPAMVQRKSLQKAFRASGKPIRYRANIPIDTLEITITEGKNRQVRKMFAAVGFPVLRLIRTGIGPFQLNDLPAGEWNEIPKDILNKFKS